MVAVRGARLRAPELAYSAGLSTYVQLPPFCLTAVRWRTHKGNKQLNTDESNEKTTVGKTTFYQGENQTHPLFRIEAGIPCKSAREQASELMGYVRELTIVGLMDEKPMMIWAAHYLSALAKALMDDAELGMMR